VYKGIRIRFSIPSPMKKRFSLSPAQTPTILTYGALERWSIVITIFETLLRKIKDDQVPPILIRTREIDDYGYNINSIRNAIDMLKKEKILEPHEKKFDEYEVKLTPNGIELLINDLNKWERIKKNSPIDSLRLSGLEILRKVLQEIDALLKGSVVK